MSTTAGAKPDRPQIPTRRHARLPGRAPSPPVTAVPTLAPSDRGAA